MEIPDRKGALQMWDGRSAHADFRAFGLDQEGNFNGGRRIVERIVRRNRFIQLRCATHVVGVVTESALRIELSLEPRAED